MLWLIRVSPKKGKKVHITRADKDRALTQYSECLKSMINQNTTIETTSGCKHASKNKVEHTMRDNNKLTRIALSIPNLPPAL